MIDTDGDFGLSVYATDSPRLHVDSGNMRLTGTMGADIYSLEDRKAELLMSIALVSRGPFPAKFSSSRRYCMIMQAITGASWKIQSCL